jgi:hypothetical protein
MSGFAIRHRWFPVGEVSELADEHDLGSCAEKAWGFESPLPHHIRLQQCLSRIAQTIESQSDTLFAKHAPCVTIIVENVSRYRRYEVEGDHSAATVDTETTEHKS